jgi:hypothetical protein
MSPTTPRPGLAYTRFDRILADAPSARTLWGRQAIAQAKVDALTIDECVDRHTAMSSLQEIVDCTLRDGYRPSLYTTPINGTSVWKLERCAMALRIADAFDAEMARLGRSERAYRGS